MQATAKVKPPASGLIRRAYQWGPMGAGARPRISVPRPHRKSPVVEPGLFARLESVDGLGAISTLGGALLCGFEL